MMNTLKSFGGWLMLVASCCLLLWIMEIDSRGCIWAAGIMAACGFALGYLLSRVDHTEGVTKEESQRREDTVATLIRGES